MATDQDARVGIAWVAAATVGFAVVGAVAHFPGSFPAGSGAMEFQPAAAAFGAVMGAGSGAIAGALLWAAARRRAWWPLIPATALGFAVTHALGDGLPYQTPYALIALVGGAALGLAQARALTPRGGTPAYTVASALGLGAGVVVGMALIEALGLMAQPWTPGLGAQQHGISSAVAGLFWGFSTSRRLGARG